MTQVFTASDNIITSLGFSTQENLMNIEKGITGITLINNESLSPAPFYASLIDSKRLLNEFAIAGNPDKFTRFEQIAILSAKDALSKTNIDAKSGKTLFILSTTKGNIDVMERKGDKANPDKSLFLWETAKTIQQYFHNPNTPLVVSNACISGVIAIITASRMIRAKQYENAVIIGADILSEFVVSGFQSFQSLSSGPCRPFDKTRDGLSLGEGAGTIILTANPDNAKAPFITVGGGSASNDANHISGPSRTGEGLYQAISKTLADPLSAAAGNIDYISAHGTATPYNDESESIAITRAGLKDVPLNTFKGYWGHTLGAAGIIESIAGIYSLENNILFKTVGFTESGVSEAINIISENKKKELNSFIKTASGFGGCNASVIFYKS